MFHTKKTEQSISVTLLVARRVGADAPLAWQKIAYTTDDRNATAASALREINADPNYKDLAGQPVGAIEWDCSCLQQKCGACAMLINGRPQLACAARLADCAEKGVIRLEPLSKFPLIRDLRVDRSILMANLKTMNLWTEQKAAPSDRRSGMVYDAARCLQCGVCLEACPNVDLQSGFFGAAGFVPAARLLSVLSDGDRERVRQQYMSHSYAGCGKSLACEKVCPAEIDITRLLLHTNAAAFFRSRGR